MTRLPAAAIGAWLACLLLPAAATPATLPNAQLEQYAQLGQKNVIVVLRDQLPNLPPMRRAMGARAAALASAQNAVAEHWPQFKSRRFHSFGSINAFATSVNSTEAAELRAHPDVLAVVNDAIVPQRPQAEARNTGSTAGLPGAAGGPAVCNTLEPEALQITNTAFLDGSVPQAQTVRDGNGFPITGRGVTVAYLADGLDPSVAGFTRADGSSVFIDYQDFSGDPSGTPTGGGEAFGDASSIAAQDVSKGHVLSYDLSHYVSPAHPLPGACNIRVRGMAPGASLVGLKVFGTGGASISGLVQAIEYAWMHDDVDVINESLGGNPLPANSNGPVDLANNAAVRAGVVVTVSTGDAGTAGTLSEESGNTAIIAVGATTSGRTYLQTSDGIVPLLRAPGYINNNISALSGAGIAQRQPKSLDVVAPGELGWALCSTNVSLFKDCVNFATAAGKPSPIETFGGTSESAPLVAGEAALVIQAYRSTHRGADPSPALVKQIIMSTATDLGAPSFEQGAGLINSLAAVHAALSVDGPGHQPSVGGSILAAPASAGITDEPGEAQRRVFHITNTGASVLHLAPTLEALGPAFAGATLTVNADPAHAPLFVNAAGNKRAYVTKSFVVPAKADHLDVAIAFQNPLSGLNNPPLVWLGLIDPAGRQAANSVPQGAGSGYGHVDVVKPQPGNWTAVIYTRIPGADGSYSGPVELSWSVQNYRSLGSVSPAHVDLPPGARVSLHAEFAMPESPGDSSAAVRFEHSPSAAGNTFPAIPLSLRTLIPIDAHGGSFSGTLSGGNGRPGTGPQQTFAFEVPPGLDDMGLSLKISDPGYLLEGLLVDPNGMQLSVQPNVDPVDNSVLPVMQLYHYNPQPGLWKFILLQNFAASGNQTSLPFAAKIAFDGARISAPTLPNHPNQRLSASGAPLKVPVRITNNSPMRQSYFADARNLSSIVMQLPPLPCGSSATLPGACAVFLLPTQAHAASFVAQSTVPISMDAVNAVGFNVGGTFNPDVFARPVSPGNLHTVVASVIEPELPYSVWGVNPALIGPFGAGGAPAGEPLATAAFVQAQPFDAAVSSEQGDLWADVVLGTNTFNPLVLAPGESGVINLTIRPDASKVDETVRGYVYIDTFNGMVSSGDEVVRLPYSYTVTP